MHIYLVTNLINNKQYIGKTKSKNPNIRFYSYKRPHNEKSNRPIIRALKKYGIDKFKIEVIYTDFSLTNEELLELETEYIKKYDCLVPKGYNVILDAKQWGSIERIQKLKLKSIQGVKKNKRKCQSKYVGVYKEYSNYECHISFKKTFTKGGFESEKDAAEAYDKMALYLYGKDCRLNFPEKKDEYLKEDLSLFYNNFNERVYTSKYSGVSLHKNIWRVNKSINGIYMNLKVLKNEIEAAELYDKVSLYLDPNFQSLNFPNKKEAYLKEDLASIYNNLAFNKDKSSKYKGVSFHKERGSYQASFRHNGKFINCGAHHKNEIDAYQAILNKKIEMNLINDIKKEVPKPITQINKETKAKILDVVKNNDGLLNINQLAIRIDVPIAKIKNLVGMLTRANKIKRDFPEENGFKRLYIIQ